MTPRVVFDCMIYLQAAANTRGAAGECVRRAIIGEFELTMSLDVLVEIQDVLTRTKTLKKFPQLTPSAVDLFLRNVSRYSLVLPSPPKVVSLPRDLKDEKYLDLAVAANAGYIVSRDNDLLDLMKPNDSEGIAFRTAHPTIEIIGPAAFLQMITTA